MYCKCGNVVGVREIFYVIFVKNVIIWNEMLYGYVQYGFGDEVLYFYNCMLIEGEKFDDVIFIVILIVCSYLGLVDEGIRIFELMYKEYEVKLFLDYYICIIDVFGRVGRLYEVEFFIVKMLCKNDLVIWEVLFSFCRVYGDVFVVK